jgi:hypothetical protein
VEATDHGSARPGALLRREALDTPRRWRSAAALIRLEVVDDSGSRAS